MKIWFIIPILLFAQIVVSQGEIVLTLGAKSMEYFDNLKKEQKLDKNFEEIFEQLNRMDAKLNLIIDRLNELGFQISEDVKKRFIEQYKGGIMSAYKSYFKYVILADKMTPFIEGRVNEILTQLDFSNDLLQTYGYAQVGNIGISMLVHHGVYYILDVPPKTKIFVFNQYKAYFDSVITTIDSLLILHEPGKLRTGQYYLFNYGYVDDDVSFENLYLKFMLVQNGIGEYGHDNFEKIENTTNHKNGLTPNPIEIRGCCVDKVPNLLVKVHRWRVALWPRRMDRYINQVLGDANVCINTKKVIINELKQIRSYAVEYKKWAERWTENPNLDITHIQHLRKQNLNP